DRLGLGVGEEPFLAQLSSEPALLDASEGRRRIELVVRIDPDRPGAQGLRRAVRLLDVARPDTGAQSVERIVRLFEDLVEALEADHRKNRAEDLLARDLHLIRDAVENRRLDEVPVRALDLRAASAEDDRG